MNTHSLKKIFTAVVLCGYIGAAQATGQLRLPIPDDPTFGLGDKYRDYKDNAAEEERERARKRPHVVPKGAKPERYFSYQPGTPLESARATTY